MQRIKKAYAENGDLKIIPETPPLDGSENWEQGRGAYYELDNDPNTGDPLALDIDREQDNYFKNVISKNIKHWQENTYPIYFNDIKYPKNAIVKYTDGNVYVSKIDNNTSLPTDANSWTIYDPSSFVKLTGDQTIDDIKTFTSSPIVPTPTTGTQSANKAYVDSALSLPTLTANTTLTGADNKIVMNGIVSSLGLEVGDVIQFTSVANANNQKLRTVENIINNNEIIVNYEHCESRGNGSLKLSNETLTNATIKRIAKWYNAPLGLGQAWVNLTGFRVGNTNYTNTTNRTIEVYASLGCSGIQNALIIVDGIETSFSSFEASNGRTGATAPVNARGVYKSYAIDGMQTVLKWTELR